MQDWSWRQELVMIMMIDVRKTKPKAFKFSGVATSLIGNLGQWPFKQN